MKILVNNPQGQQEIIEVLEGGMYFDAGRVLWDELIDGPMPEVTLGGMVRDGACLVFDQAKFDETANLPISKEQHNAAIIAQLERIDAKSIRPLREGDLQRVAEYETEAATLRMQLIKV
jgi:hypothetical protein